MELPIFQDPNQNLMLMQSRWAAILNRLLKNSTAQWSSYIPVTQGFGAIQLSFCRFQIIDDICSIQAYFLCGTPTSDQAQFGLPPSLIADIPTNFSVNPTTPGSLMCGMAYTNNVSATSSGQLLPQVTQNLSYLTFGIVQSNVNPFAAQNASAFCAAGSIVSLNANVPIVT